MEVDGDYDNDSGEDGNDDDLLEAAGPLTTYLNITPRELILL